MKRMFWFFLSVVENWVFNREVFGRVPHASDLEYRNLFEEATSRSYPDIDKFEESCGYGVNSQWLGELALQTQVVVKKSPLNWQHGRLLYAVLRSYLSSRSDTPSPIVIFETGTARGFSAVTMARALLDSGREGVVFTVDSLPHNTQMYWNCIGDSQGKRSRKELLASWPEEVSRTIFFQAFTPQQLGRFGLDHIGFAFLDAQHTFPAVMEEFNFVSERQLAGDIIVFDDVTPSIFPGVARAVEEIQKSGLYSIELYGDPDRRGYAIATRVVD